MFSHSGQQSQMCKATVSHYELLSLHITPTLPHSALGYWMSAKHIYFCCYQFPVTLCLGEMPEGYCEPGGGGSSFSFQLLLRPVLLAVPFSITQQHFFTQAVVVHSVGAINTRLPFSLSLQNQSHAARRDTVSAGSVPTFEVWVTLTGPSPGLRSTSTSQLPPHLGV